MDPNNATFRNPLKEDGPDPWLAFHDGFYYLSTTSMDDIRVRRAAHLADLKTAPDVVVWKDDTPSRSRHLWAPEFYLLDGPRGRRWYLYYTASDDADVNHRLHVLESAGTDPLGPYSYVGNLLTDPDDGYYAIDGSVLVGAGGSLYLLWAGHPGHVLFISRLSNPWTLTGPRVHLPAGGFGCEEVREGPVALQRGGRIFLVYSACDTGKPDYKLGMLVAEEGSDLMNPASWRQHPAPVFTRDDAAGVFGPGHNHFFKSPDGSQDWIVYHAKAESRYTYEGRSTRAQPITWDADGAPDFGTPLSLDTDIPVPAGETHTTLEGATTRG